MLQTNVEVNWDRQAVERYMEKQLDGVIQSRLWLVDLEKISQLTCMSKRWLEDEIISDPRMKVIEIKKSRKRWWPAEKAFQIINEITNSW